MDKKPLSVDFKSTALVLIDLQHGIVAMDVAPITGVQVIQRCAALAQRFRELGAPVVLVTVGNLADEGDMLRPIADAMAPAGVRRPENWSTLVPEIGPKAGDILIRKRQWGAFYGTELDLQLRRRGINTIVLAGIATNVGVESTARDAFEHGYNQIFVSDAMASTSREAHEATLKFTFPRIGLTRNSEEVLQALK